MSRRRSTTHDAGTRPEPPTPRHPAAGRSVALPVRVLSAVAVATLVVGAAQRVALGQGPWWLDALVVTVAVVAAGWWWTQVGPGRRRPAPPDRPGWRTHRVRVALPVPDLLRHLEPPAGPVRDGALLTLAWSASEVELWRDGTVVTTVRWDRVRSVDRAVCRAAGLRLMGLCLTTNTGGRLHVVPLLRAGGRLLPGTTPQVRALVGELAAVRRAAQPPPRPAAPPRPSLPQRPRLRVHSARDGRVVDVELSRAVLLATGRYRDAARLEAEHLGPDVAATDAPDGVDADWAQLSREIETVPVGEGVSDPRAAVRAFLAAEHPELSDDAAAALVTRYSLLHR